MRKATPTTTTATSPAWPIWPRWSLHSPIATTRCPSCSTPPGLGIFMRTRQKTTDYRPNQRGPAVHVYLWRGRQRHRLANHLWRFPLVLSLHQLGRAILYLQCFRNIRELHNEYPSLYACPLVIGSIGVYQFLAFCIRIIQPLLDRLRIRERYGIPYFKGDFSNALLQKEGEENLKTAMKDFVKVLVTPVLMWV